MQNVTVRRYADPKSTGWAGYLEPEDKSWIGFVGLDGRPLFLHRDERTGAVLPDDPAAREEALALVRDEEARREAFAEPVEGVHFPVLAGEPFAAPPLLGSPMPPSSFGIFDAAGALVGEQRDGRSPDGFVADGMLAARLATCLRPDPAASGSMALAL